MMMMRIFLAVVACLMMGQTWSQSTKFEYVESGLTLRMMAPVDPGGNRRFVLNIQTNDVYECAGVFVENDAALQGNKLLLKVKGVQIPDPCSPMMAPAVANIDLSKLSPGKYPVRITVNRQVFQADLEVTPTYYHFTIDEGTDPTLLRIYNGRLNVIPSGTIWGVCKYTQEDQKATALSFMKELQGVGATVTNLAAGNYDEFYLHGIGQTQEKVITAGKYEYPFVYSYTGDMEPIKAIVTKYAGKISVTLKDTQGAVIQN